ncbi:MAG: SET domain-containing protein [Myxococcales bacterium]|nr:SET domain-containing protein [Myxococcales bacterium]
MLLVPTVVAPSPIAGMGLFLAADLPAGTVIWEFHPGVDCRFTADEVSAFPEPFQARLRHYLYQEEDGLYVLCGDNTRFMNHADDPTCAEFPDGRTFLRRDVQAGEELTIDYHALDAETRAHGMQHDAPGANTW